MTARLQTYTYKEAAQLLRVSRWTLRRAVQRRQLKATRVGSRRVVFRESELERYLSARTK